MRKQKIKFFYKKSYENKSIFIDGFEYDLSLIWNSVEDKGTEVVKISTILNNINNQNILKNKNNYTPFEYPVLVYKNIILDGHSSVYNNIKKGKKTISIITVSKKDINFAKMD